MLKMTQLLDKLASSRNDGSKSASSRNDNNMPAVRRNNSNGEDDEFDGNSIKHAKKLGKSKKLSKSRKSAKSGKKLSKSGNLFNFDTMNNKSSFITPEARAAFNRLWLAFTNVPILQYFDLGCQVWIETEALGYVISGVLSQLISGTRPYRVITNTDLNQ